MKQTKQFLRPLLMAIVMLVGMLVPQGAWAQDLRVDCETVTISEDASYDMIYVWPGGKLIINKGVTLTVTDQIIFQGDDLPYGTVINYGTIIGEGYINKKDSGVLANHGHIDLSGASGNGTFTFYNTGTLGENINLTPTEECNHAWYENFTVAATCTHGAGTQYRCYTCYYMWLDETSGALPHRFNSHNGINICSSCGHKTYDEPTNGDGYEDDPYQIANAGNLYWFANYTRNEDEYANAILTADIVLNDGTFATDGTFTATGADEPSKPFPWIRIGNAYGNYYGTFDGNGHTISGMYVNGRFGLFYNFGGSVVNLGIVNCYIRDNSVTGAICYWNYGTISNCYTTGILSGSYSCGICDTNISGSTISNCYSTCSFVNDIFFDGGGICGTNLGTISNCYTSYDTAIKHNNKTASEVYGGVSADRFASGEIAYKLNGSIDGEGSWTAGATNGTQKWYQKLGENGDSYPVLAAAEGNTVYAGYESCASENLSYSNANTLYATKEEAHVWEDGKCTVCTTDCEHDWEEYGEYVHKCNICELETDHDWSNGDSKCAVCEYVCQHKVEDYEMWENGKCTICGYECQHEFEPVDDGYKEGFFIGHICSICDFEEEHDFSNKDGKCTACGYVCYHNEINDCVCTICGNACHEWWEGVCINCGTWCEHNKKVWLEEAQEATCVSQGKAVDYYQCECGLYFADEECTNPLSWDDIIIPAKGHSIENSTCTACGATVTIAGTLSFEEENTVTFWNECYKLFEDPTAAPLYSFECDGNGNLTISSDTEFPYAKYFLFDSNFHYMGTWEFMDNIGIENPGTYYLIPTYNRENEEETKVEGQTITLSWEGETVCQHTGFESEDNWFHICKECGEWFPHSIAEEDGQCVCGFECPGHEWGFDVNEIYAACQETPNTMIQHCDYCHYTKEEVVDPNGECPNGDSHDWYEDSYAATCVQHGYTKHWCEKCDARYLDNFSADIDPDVHDWEADQDSHWCCNGCEAHGSYEEHTMDENGKCTVCGYKECQHTDFESVNNWNHICKECGESFKHYIEEDGGECVCGFKCTKHRFYVNAIASVEATENINDGKIYVVEECECCQVQGEPKVVDTKSECSKSKNHNHFWVRYTTDVMPTTKEGGIAKISCWYCDESYFVRVLADPDACTEYWGHNWYESDGNIVCSYEDCGKTITPTTLAMGENAGIDVDASVHHYDWDPSSAPLYKFVPENSGPYDFKIKDPSSADCKVFIFETNEDDHLDMNIQDVDHYAFEARKNYYLQFLTTDVDVDRNPIAYKGATIVVSESTQLVIAAAADASVDSEPVVIVKDEKTGEWSTEQNIVLTDGVESFSTPVDFTAPQVDYERLMPNSQWGTLCLPFDITVDAAKPYAFYELTSATSTEVTLTKVDDGTLQAGTPVLVRRNASETGVHFTETSENGITIKAMRDQSESEVKDGLQMIGVFMPYELYGGSYYLDAEDGMLYDTGEYYNETGDPVKVNAYRCYFDVVGRHDEARPLNIVFEEEEVSALEAIRALTQGKAEIYDIYGNRRNDLQQGVNIVNGKKVVVE